MNAPCPNCGHAANRPGARFCAACGAGLAPPPRAASRPSLGARLITPPAAIPPLLINLTQLFLPLGAFLLLVGSFLDWRTYGNVHVTGFSSDVDRSGLCTLLSGLLLSCLYVALYAPRVRRLPQVPVRLAAIALIGASSLITVILALDIILDNVSKTGIGVFVVLVGALAATGSSVWVWWRR